MQKRIQAATFGFVFQMHQHPVALQSSVTAAGTALLSLCPATNQNKQQRKRWPAPQYGTLGHC